MSTAENEYRIFLEEVEETIKETMAQSAHLIRFQLLSKNLKGSDQKIIEQKLSEYEIQIKIQIADNLAQFKSHMNTTIGQHYNDIQFCQSMFQARMKQRELKKQTSKEQLNRVINQKMASCNSDQDAYFRSFEEEFHVQSKSDLDEQIESKEQMLLNWL